MKGDWQAAAVLLQRNPNLASAQITESGDTALHIAAATSHTKFVRELVGRMAEGDLLSKNKHGYTAFTHVKDRSITEWFDFLIATIRNNMHDTALDILNKNSDGTLATMRTTIVIPGENDSPDTTKKKGTALHELAVQDISDISASREAITDSFNTMFAAVPLFSREHSRNVVTHFSIQQMHLGPRSFMILASTEAFNYLQSTL
ncbi:UNVERIFIED_CONTAM: hypothetical protein Scaly_1330000 [Sesamum calycinum]|uniref:Uncharacterized protein n=1 Tax=Sesamum calycinum TaxID=2727403 RepID=A0AAW2Q7I6_9LAMI